MKFVVAGAFSKFMQLYKFFILNKKMLKVFDFVVYDGVCDCHWNGGRINSGVYYTDSQINFYYKNNIGIALTFSNHNIDLSDAIGNELLKKFNRKGNLIILQNEDLRKYIRKNYPLYELTYSITGTGKLNIPMEMSDVDFYKDLESKYDLIVPRMEHIFDPLFIEYLNMDKYEIMLNDDCRYNCPYYHDHFIKISNQNTLYDHPSIELSDDYRFNIEECWLDDYDPDIGENQNHCDSYGMDLTDDQIERLISMGIHYFKISGRELPSEEFYLELKKCKDILYAVT